ncbi:hypothetical protein BDK88_0183 [Natrinema hispanicum]|uniref:Uncharacterized protein n=1 Tax=Natrinema hispanicum TaxID=392421 RepID=A0A482YEL9_9EURY|nr:hypothetical protein BDK88_0183 [Natrinema hispanicum]
MMNPVAGQNSSTCGRRSTGVSEIAIQTSNTTRDKPLPDDCRAVTTVTVATAIAELSVSVTVDGPTVRTVEQVDTDASAPSSRIRSKQTDECRQSRYRTPA